MTRPTWLLLLLCLLAPRAMAEEPVLFDWFDYRGHDTVFDAPLPAGHYRNPVLAGFHPDPSITRAGDRFYLVTSSFAFFPGIPVFESPDLVHWQQIGNVIDLPGQLDFDGLGMSRGVFAPTIAFHDGTFYVANTAVDSGGNFIATAKDPAGPWSDPTWLPGIGGIDPALFFDDDGRVYLLNNDAPQGQPRYPGHRAIWMQQLDLATLVPFGLRRVLIDGGVDPSTDPIWIEGPHIFKRDGWYYLNCAEGGTGPQHSQVISRSRTVWGPYTPFAGNPILTQRDLRDDRADPITNAGHADLVEGPDGTWWATFLASRNYGQTHYNTGRETFLLPVAWKNGWPTILQPGRQIPYLAPGPTFLQHDNLPQPSTGNFTWRDDFDQATLDRAWMYVRVPKTRWADLSSHPGQLAITPSAQDLAALGNPAFLGRRQQHTTFEASTAVALPLAAGTEAGLAAFQNESHWYFLGVRHASQGGQELFLERSSRFGRRVVTTAPLPALASLQLRITGSGGEYGFAYDTGQGWQWLKQHEDGTVLSTDVAGGFIGVVLGPHARTTGSDAPATTVTGSEAPATPAMDGDAPWLDTNLGFAERAALLVSRMTLAEKAAQMQNAAPAIARLGVPAYDWWNEALHGVARAGGATVFPQAIGMAATFDVPLMDVVSSAISDEARAKHHDAAARGARGRYQGLTFWSPNINIFRDPRWGRGQETYGEDPYLTARMGISFVRGLQGDDPVYRKLDATAKHFAVHSGPEADRHHFDARPSRRDLHETYLPAFEALVKEGDVDAVMGAYNRVYGESASASHLLLRDILRKDWGFKGYVMSDCWAVDDIWKSHHIVATVEAAAALAVRNGTQLECGESYALALPIAVRQGLISEADIDAALVDLMTARFRLGMFDPPDRVRWARIPISVNQSPGHDALARRAARESIVLLKNDGVLPLSSDVRRIAVVGPTADDTMALLGNYYGTPAAPVTILQGIRAAAPLAEVRYARGADLVPGRDDPSAMPLVDAQFLRPSPDSAERGLRGEYFSNPDLSGQPALVRVDARILFDWDRGSPTDNLMARGEASAAQAVPNDNFSIRWRGQLLPPVTGTYQLQVAADDGVRLYLDGKRVLDHWAAVDRLSAHTVSVDLVAGRAYDLSLEYFDAQRDAGVRLAWAMPDAAAPLDEALAIARQSDVVVFVGGLTGDVEGEEMKVDYPGFSGGDRTDIRLPATQQVLLEALQATGKPVVMVLTTGSALAVDWAQAHLPAIVLAWYPGQRGGSAVADVLFGLANPGGRLPVTFYKADERLPAFDDYAMEGRTYRYFKGQALYPFGHGLSYTHFAYSNLALAGRRGTADTRVALTVDIRNDGTRAGDEVVQLYLQPRHRSGRAIRELRGFQRVTLQPGEQRTLTFAFTPTTDLRTWDGASNAYVVEPGTYAVQVGASSADIRLERSYTVSTR